ncbi:regucalcin-like [Coccinella septempunctata]|uniref:regucalcin-like n=1 Tax=Coccinella septempunctata TaxID=41139 RepID=UPI001D069454|nr:regucalcin-like [Coccinella septempunctata]
MLHSVYSYRWNLSRVATTINMFIVALFVTQFSLSWAHIRSPGVYQLTPPIDHAEGPTWDPRRELLFYVDIHSGTIFSYEHCSGKTHSLSLYGDVTPIVPSKRENIFFVGLNRSLVALEWDGKNKVGKQKILSTVSPQYPTSRFNDGKADKKGRLWFGTMGYENSSGVLPDEGLLYKFTKESYDKPTPIIAPVNISNGMAWNKKNDKFYYIDTPTQKIVEYDFDVEKGEIRNKRTVFDLRNQSFVTGYPDGMTIDEDDNLWVALYNGGAVIKINPKTRKLLQVVAIPALAVTSVAWGGPKLDILYVTTSRFALKPEERKQQPAAGAIFAITDLGTRGLPSYEADIIDSI